MIPSKAFLFFSWIIAIAKGSSYAPRPGLHVINKDLQKRCEKINTHGHTEADPNVDPSGRYDPLECWLWNLQIIVPDQTFHESFFSLKIEDLVCTHFEIGSFQSTPNSFSSNPFLDVYISNVGADCEGKYSTTGFSGKMSASIRTLSGDPLHLQVTFTSADVTIPEIMLTPSLSIEDSKQYHIAKSGNVTNCVANLEVPKGGLKFYGSVSATFINQFAPQIASFISFEASSQLCSVITPGINNILTNQITKANKYLMKLIGDQDKDRGEDDDIMNDDDMNENGDKFVRWDIGVPILQQGLQSTNAFLSNYLDKGIIPLSRSSYSTALPSEQPINVESRKLLSSFPIGAHLPPNALYPPHPQKLDQCDGLLFTGINGLIKKLTNNTNSVKITIPKEYSHVHFPIAGYGDIYLNLDAFSIGGLNSFDKVEIFEPIKKRSATSEVKFSDQVNITMHLNLLVKPIPGGSIHGDPLEEKFDLIIGFSEAHFQTLSEMKVFEENFHYIMMGHVISLIAEYVKTLQNIDLGQSSVKELDWNCIMSSFQSLRFTDITGDMILDGIRFFNVASHQHSTSTLEDEIDVLISTILNLMLQEYNLFVKDALNGLFYGPLRGFINDFFQDVIHKSGGGSVHNGKVCKAVFPANDENMIHFDENRVFEFLESISDQIFGAGNANSVMECMNLYKNLDNQSWNPLYQKDMDGFSITLSDLDFGHMDNFQKITLLKPEIDHYHVKNQLDFSGCDKSGKVADEICNPTSISLTLISENEGLNMTNTINMTLFVNQLESQMGLFTKYNMHKLYLIRFSQLMKSLQCGLSPMAEFEIYDLLNILTFDSIHIDMNLTKRTSTLYKYIVLDGEDMNNGLASLLSRGASMLEDSSNKAFPNFLSKASYICEGAIVPPDNQKHYARDVVSLFRDILLSILLIIFIAMFFVQKPKRLSRPADTEMIEVESPEDSSNDRYDQDMLTFLLLENFDDDQETVELEDFNPSESTSSNAENNFEIEEIARDPSLSSEVSLLFNENISLWVRCSVPICLVATIVLFISSNISDGASVQMKLTSASGKSFDLPLPIFKFSLANTINEMYQARVYTLMVIVAVFSGIWPYVKLLSMIIAWTIPPAMLSISKREKLLIQLDALGKYSLVDANILVIMMVAFSLHLDFEDAYSVDVFVIPEYGFYSFLIGTILSLVMGHFILFIHRQMLLRHEIRSGGNKESLRNHCFIGIDTLGGLRFTRCLQSFVIAYLICTIILLIFSMNVKSFYFFIQGVTGYMIGDDRAEGYSLLSLGKALVQSVEDPNSIGIRSIQITFYFFAAVMPITSMIILLILYCLPMTLRNQRRTFIMAEILSAWSATEVFLLSILAGLWQLSEFATFIVGDKCDLLNKILKDYFSGELGEDTFCFGINAKATWESMYLVAGVIMSTSMTTFLLRIAHQAIEERMQRQGDLDKEYNFEDTIIDKIYKMPCSGCLLAETSNDLDVDESIYTFDSEGRRYERDEKKAASFDGLVESLNEPLLSAFNNSF